MNNYTRTPRASRRSKKAGLRRTLLVVCMMLVVMVGSIAGTVAWLTDTTDEVKNTFTTSGIEIELKENTTEYKMVPGHTIEKDPAATVLANSENCWLFVEVTESDNFDDFMTYEIADGWTLVEGTTNVYARRVDGTTNKIGTAYPVLKDNKVTVLTTVTKEVMTELTDETKPTLTFKAYAVQLMKDNNTEFTAVEAWANKPTSAN